MGVTRTSAEEHIQQAIAHQLSGQHWHAVVDFSRAIKLNPDSNVYYQRGSAYLGLGEYRAAVEDLCKSINLKPGSTAYFKRGMLYRLLAQPDKAIADFSSALALDPGLDDARVQRELATHELRGTRQVGGCPVGHSNGTKASPKR